MNRLINTEEFIKRIDHYPPDIRDIAKKELRYCKTADAVPVVHAHWHHSFGGFVECSNCGDPPLLGGEREYVESAYCPSCGASMDEVVES